MFSSLEQYENRPIYQREVATWTIGFLILFNYFFPHSESAEHTVLRKFKGNKYMNEIYLTINKLIYALIKALWQLKDVWCNH